MSNIANDHQDEGFAWLTFGAAQERKAIVDYLKDVLNNVRVLDSPIGSAQAIVQTIIEEIEEDIHHKKGSSL